MPNPSIETQIKFDLLSIEVINNLSEIKLVKSRIEDSCEHQAYYCMLINGILEYSISIFREDHRHIDLIRSCRYDIEFKTSFNNYSYYVRVHFEGIIDNEDDD